MTTRKRKATGAAAEESSRPGPDKVYDESLTIAIERAVKEELRTVAKARGVTPSVIARWAIERGLPLVRGDVR